MSDQQPRTPTTDLMRRWHVLADHSGNKSTEEYEAEFDRWLATVEAAAERRGAIKALLEAAESKSLIDYMYTNLHVNQPAVVREAAKYLHNRADLLESDDE